MPKKDFSAALPPAERFISSRPEAPAPGPAPYIVEGYRVDPRYIENKTRRVQLLLRPSLYAKLEEEARQQGLSFNEYAHRLLEAGAGKE